MVRMVNAIARTIPTVNTNLAGPARDGRSKAVNLRLLAFAAPAPTTLKEKPRRAEASSS
jgi:hypothetical protein